MDFLIFLFACMAAGLTGSLFPPGKWYSDLHKPRWTPPNWIFPKEHGVQLQAYSDELLTAVGNRASEVLPQIASKSSDAKALYNEIVGIRESMLDWSTYAEGTYLEARKSAQMKKI